MNRGFSILKSWPSLFGLLALASLTVIGTACGGASPTPTPEPIRLTTPIADPTATPGPKLTTSDGQVTAIELNMSANGSPQQGTATFTRLDDGVRLKIRLEPAVRSQIVSLRYGTCEAPTGFKDTLQHVIGGYMTQDIRDLGMEELTSTGMTLVVSVDSLSYNSIAACAELPLIN